MSTPQMEKLIAAVELLIRTLGDTQGSTHLAVLNAQAIIAECRAEAGTQTLFGRPYVEVDNAELPGFEIKFGPEGGDK